MESIRDHGLLHPVVVRDNGTLVAGERRLRAIRDLHQLGISFRCGAVEVGRDEVPTLTLGELSPLAALEAELEENVQRTDLTWQERATAVSRVAEIRGEQARLRGEAPPTPADIAEEVRGRRDGEYQSTTRKELILAQHLHNPEVAKAKSVDEAFKALKRQEEGRKNALLAERYGAEFTAETHTLRLGSCYDLAMTGLELYDVIITDPPYGIGADEFGDSDGAAAGAHGYLDSFNAADAALRFLAYEALKLVKPQAHMYVFCDIDWFFDYRDALEQAGWWVHRTPLIWHKPGGLRTPWPEHTPQRRYELIIFAIKGAKPVTRIAGDVLTFPSDDNLGHSAQKPVALFQDLLSRSVHPGDSVLDPFCGTGPVFPAAHALKCRATGFEIDPASYGIALTRIKELK
jgi:DNA modification methylase